jgi:hypothetical protein
MKGTSGFCVEVAGFELLFWRPLPEGQFPEPSKIKASVNRHTEQYVKKSSALWYGCGTKTSFISSQFCLHFLSRNYNLHYANSPV